MMKRALFFVMLFGAFSAGAFDCPKGHENYLAEILPLRHQQDALADRINRAADTKTEIALVKQSIALDDRISAIERRMNECDGIGQSILKDVKN